MLKKINKAIVSKKNKDIVTVANAVFVKNDSKMEAPFVTRNKDVFQCEVRNADFEDPASACASINAWVRNETQGEWPRVPGTSGGGFLLCGRRRESGSETLPGVSESSGPPVVKALDPTDCTVLSLLEALRLSLSSSFPFPDVGTARATPPGTCLPVAQGPGQNTIRGFSLFLDASHVQVPVPSSLSVLQIFFPSFLPASIFASPLPRMCFSAFKIWDWALPTHSCLSLLKYS